MLLTVFVELWREVGKTELKSGFQFVGLVFKLLFSQSCIINFALAYSRINKRVQLRVYFGAV